MASRSKNYKHKFKWKNLRTKTKQKIIWGAIALFAVVCVGIIVYTSQNAKTYNFEDEFDRYAKTVADNKNTIDRLNDEYISKFDKSDICVCFGDSITGNMEAPNDYPSVIEQKSGMTVINAGFGGCRMGTHTSHEYDAFSMYRLADAITTGDWSLQEQNVIMLPMSYASERLNTLKNINWNDVSVITIAFGTNDINALLPLEDDTNRVATNTVVGALRYSIDRIHKTYPHIKIIVATPIYRFWSADAEDSDSKNFDGKKFVDYVDGIKSVAEEYHIPCVDLYRNSGFNTLNKEFYYQEDGIHPNSKGLEVIGRQMAAAIWNYC